MRSANRGFRSQAGVFGRDSYDLGTLDRSWQQGLGRGYLSGRLCIPPPVKPDSRRSNQRGIQQPPKHRGYSYRSDGMRDRGSGSGGSSLIKPLAPSVQSLFPQHPQSGQTLHQRIGHIDKVSPSINHRSHPTSISTYIKLLTPSESLPNCSFNAWLRAGAFNVKRRTCKTIRSAGVSQIGMHMARYLRDLRNAQESAMATLSML